MAKVLFVKGSPRGDRSKSNQVAEAFLAAYQQKHRGDQVDTFDLFKEELPPFDGFVINAKYAILNGKDHTPEEKAAWQAVEEVIERFKSADKYVFSVPMWNFGIPYRLKQFFDVITQPGYTFSFDPQTGYTGLMNGRPVFATYARGGEYSSSPEMMQLDKQKPYLEQILGFIGISDISTVLIEPTLAGGPDTAEEKLAAALDDAKKLAESF